MKRFAFFQLLGMLVLPLGLLAQTEVSGSITSDATWTSGNSYVLKGSITIRNNAVLTIEQDVTVDLGSYTITVGSSTAGKLNADGANFMSSSASDHKIMFQDGGGGILHQCSFTNVFVDINSDAAPGIELTGNSFTAVQYPVTADINRLPVFTGNSGSPELIGLSGTLAESLTLEHLQWRYILTATLTVRSSAILTIAQSVELDLNNTSIYIGSSSAGELRANGVNFTGAGTSDKTIYFRDGSSGSLTSCNFDNVTVDIAGDAASGIQISNNVFRNIKFPVSIESTSIPILSGNTSDVDLVGVSGTLIENAALPKLEWDYKLSSSMTVRGSAVITLANDVNFDLGNYTLKIGSSTPGTIIAAGVNFLATGSSDRYIQFSDGSTGDFSNCDFNNVYLNIDEDAGSPINLTGNSFDQVQYPVKMHPLRPPVMSGNSSTEEWIALKGTLKSDAELPVLPWDYVLSESILVRDGAILTLTPGTRIFLNNRNLYVGSGSTNLGNIQADGACFYDLPNKSGRVFFRTNSIGDITNSMFDQCRLYLDGASPTVTRTRFYHCATALYLTGAANPVLHQNDFYNNGVALDNRGSLEINAENNFWAHPTGPQHPLRTDGEGENISGSVDFLPFSAVPFTGSLGALLDPGKIVFGDVLTGQKCDSSFLIHNTGDIDLLISDIQSSSSSISVRMPDRIWILPDSAARIPFTYTALQPGDHRDSILMKPNIASDPWLEMIVEAEGRIDNILLNFYHIDVDSFPVVKCHFSVTDQSYLPIRELVHDNIGVSEQNLNIPDFELLGRSENRAIRVALVTDRSGSMAGQQLRDAKSAAIDFIGELNAMDEAALVSFSNSASLNLGFTSDKTALAAAVNSLRSDGATALFDALYMAVNLVKEKDGIRAVLALTDGEDNSSSKTPAEVINLANQFGVNIYTIGLGAESDKTMSMIASQTGGQFFYSPTSDELALIYRMISGQLQNLYVIRYVASETLPFPRRVELSVHVYSQADTAVRYYSMGSSSIEFVGSGQPFKREDFSTDSKDYFYYYVDTQTNELPEGLSFNYYMESNDHTIPCGGEYLGDGIMQFWADFRGIEESGNYPIVIPDSVDQSGGYLKFTSKPGPFTVVLNKRDITQSIDVFAGGSAGVRALAGALGAGPSIAAVCVSASGSAGMGINFERNAAGDEWVTRRLEAGITYKAQSPKINTGIEAVTAGASAEVSLKGTVGQTMLFPGDAADPSLMLKAKAAYLLETMSFGGMVVSPWFGIVLTAVQQALVALNPDVDELYEDIFESWNLGANIEGKVGVEFEVTPAKSSSLPKFTFAEASLSMGLSGTFTHMVQSDNLGFGIALAVGFDVAFINLSVGNVSLGSVFKDKGGAEVSLESEYSPSDGLLGFNMSFLAYNSPSLNLAQGFYGSLYSVEVPPPVIDRAVATAGNIISDVGKILKDGSVPGIRVGAGYFSDAMDAFFGMDEDTLGSVNNHIVVSTTSQLSKGINAEVKVGLDGALGVGIGVEFGVSFSYLDKLSALTDEYVIAHGKILPTAEYPGIFARDNLFSLTDEMKDLFDGVVDLVADGLKNLVRVGEYLIDAGIDFLSDFPDYAGSISGTLQSGGKAIIRTFDPRKWSVITQPFMEPEVIRAYLSPRVVHPTGKGNVKSGYDTASTLYLVSNAYNVTIFDDTNQPVEDFDPLRFKAAINNEMLTDLGFGDAEKSLAKIYFYNTGDMSWIAVSPDLEAYPDTVGSDISKSGNYAVGIEIFPAHDKTAPEIIDHYPPEGGTIQPDGRIWAKLFEEPTGTGIDFGNTRILVDGAERDATWDPVNSILAWKSPVPLVDGVHEYTIQVADYQGNGSDLTVSFTVKSSGIFTPTAASTLELSVYPNPAMENLTIEFETQNPVSCDVAVYNTAGIRVASLYRGKSGQGVNKFVWSRVTDDGKLAGAGLYFVRVRLDGEVVVRKVILE